MPDSLKAEPFKTDTWEEFIPFYVAGTLPKADVQRFEKHLAHCDACQQSLQEWHRIAAAVRADAASQLRGLPPLAPRVIATANRQAAGRYDYAPSLVRQPSRAATTSLTLVAAVFTVVLLGGLLALMVLNGSLLRRQADQVVLAPTEAPTETTSIVQPSATPQPLVSPANQSRVPQIIVIEPSATPIRPATQPLIAQPTVQPTVQPTATIPTFIFPTQFPTQVPQVILPPTQAPTQAPIFAPTIAPTQEILGMGGGDNSTFSLMQSTICTARVAIPSGVVNLYASPSTSSAVLAAIAQSDTLTALARNGSGWMQVEYTGGASPLTGWVQQASVYTSGNCDGLPLNDSSGSASATSPQIRPTATVLPFPTPSPAAMSVAAGQWTQTHVVTANGCGTSDADATTQMSVSLTPNGTSLGVVYGSQGMLTLMRIDASTYSGSTGVSQGILTLTLTFSSSNAYSGSEVVTHSDGCVVQASLSGSLSR